MVRARGACKAECPPYLVIHVNGQRSVHIDTSKSKILRIKERRAYRDGIKRKGDKIGMVSVVCSLME